MYVGTVQGLRREKMGTRLRRRDQTGGRRAQA